MHRAFRFRHRPCPPRRVAGAALLCAVVLWGALALLLAACSAGGDRIEQFRATHTRCNPSHYRKPCQIGPDGLLYQYNPGEQ